MEVINIGFDKIQQFSKRDKDYHLTPDKFSDFFNLPADMDSFPKMIEERKKFPVNRTVLTDYLRQQYADSKYINITKNIDLLSNDNCFTVCTAHQPSLLTGPLYYILKSLSTVKLSIELNNTFPEYSFVPVFVHGSEDHDFEEINHLHLFNKKVEWQGQETGATGRMMHDGITEVLSEVEQILGASEFTKNFIDYATHSLKRTKTYGDFVIKLNDFFFGKYGLIQMSMDDPTLKNGFRDLLKKEILEQFSFNLVSQQIDKLSSLNYKPQATPREINLFYLTPGGRNRIIKTASGFNVIDTDIHFTKEEILVDIEKHPENYSPNVVLRPLYQETILPNLAYIGGGGEIAYWLERKSQFAEAKLPFPILIRRSSAAIIDRKKVDQWKNLGMSTAQLANDIHVLEKTLVVNDSDDNATLDFSQVIDDIRSIYNDLSLRVKAIDPTLEKSTLSELQKVEKGINQMESKVTRSLKQKNEVKLNRLRKVHQALFPTNSLQERKTNFLEFYSRYGDQLIDKMLDHLNPLEKDFKLFVMD